jgi:membrane associated rhomboid family serine protease
VFALLAVMWVLEILDALLPGDWDLYGIHPRNTDGLSGVFLSPLLHAGFRHLMANSVPFLVLGCLVAIDGARRFWAVTGIVALVAGLGVWLISPSATVTIGASSLIFGYLGYLVVNGIRTRRARDILVALGVLLLYGSSLLGAVPWLVGPGVSWQGHMFGAIGGGLAAWWLAPVTRVP